MNEAEWLASEDPGAMLGASWPGRPSQLLSDRKLRLFACACCRLAWPLLTDPRSREAVLVAERYADGLASEGERNDAWHHVSVADGMNAVAFDLCNRHGIAWQAVPGRILREMDGHPVERRVASAAQAALLHCVCGNPFRPVRLEPTFLGCRCPRGGGGPYDVLEDVWYCRRCGHPARTERQPWLCPTVLALAHTAYETGREVPCGPCGRCGGTGRRVGSPPPGAEWPDPRCPDCKGTGRASDGLLDPGRLAVLADALEEAGCDDEDVLRHLRGWERCPHCLDTPGKQVVYYEDGPAEYGCLTCQPSNGYWGTGWRPLRGPHAKGCWALDLLLGRS